ncbi:MAG: RNA polymerase sigma factor [Sandaracinaceae bacterium]
MDDLVQQTFLRVHTSRARYTMDRTAGERSVDAWFMTTAIRTLLDYRRHEHRRIARVGQLSSFRDPSAFGAPPPTQTAEQQLSAAQEQQRLRQAVRAAVDALPHDARDIVRRHKLEGQTIQGMAGELGIAAGTLRVRAHRAYRKLADSLRPLSTQTA